MAENTLDPMIDISKCDTEYFVNPCGYRSYDSEDDDYKSDDQSVDIRYILDKKLYNFDTIINQIGGRIKYIKSGTTGHTFKGIITIEDGSHINYGVKVVAYPKKGKYGSMHNVSRPENAELMMIRLLSYFIVRKQTPHIVLPIGAYNTNIKPFINLDKTKVIDKENDKYRIFKERYNNKEYYDYVSILISEWANKGDLLDFIRKNYREFSEKTWKVLFFQIISVLAVIQSKFPTFRHNDLKANNILVHKTKRKKKSRCIYTVNKCKYCVPNIGYQIRLWNFDLSSMIINSNNSYNKYYDLHYFFNTLINEYKYINMSHIPSKVIEFLTRVVPKEYRTGKHVTHSGHIMNHIEYTTPNKILSEDCFIDEFK